MVLPSSLLVGATAVQPSGRPGVAQVQIGGRRSGRGRCRGRVETSPKPSVQVPATRALSLSSSRAQGALDHLGAAAGLAGQRPPEHLRPHLEGAARGRRARGGVLELVAAGRRRGRVDGLFALVGGERLVGDAHVDPLLLAAREVGELGALDHDHEVLSAEPPPWRPLRTCCPRRCGTSRSSGRRRGARARPRSWRPCPCGA